MGIDTNRVCYGCFNEHDGVGSCPHCGFNIATAKHPAIALPIGTILNGRYLTGRVLGVGGFGITYLALDMTLETSVAVKEYLPSGIAIRDKDHYTMTVTSEEEQSKYDYGANKFLEEARVLAKLRTVPNIVTVHDYFRENGTAYFVMEYIEGVDLLKYAKLKGGKLSFEETRDLLLPIIKSLGEVHDHQLLHRDIGPDNIIVTKHGTTHLLDFGAARLAIDSTKSTSIILKHGFAPEEQYRKHGNQGPWSDEYALAATMYLIITGVMPPDAIDRMHEDTLVPPKDLGIAIPDYANDALVKALAVHASGRFPDMESFAKAITGKGAASGSAASASTATAAAFSGASASAAAGSSFAASSTGSAFASYKPSAKDAYVDGPTVAMDEPTVALEEPAASAPAAPAPSPFAPPRAESAAPSPFAPPRASSPMQAASSAFAPAGTSGSASSAASAAASASNIERGAMPVLLPKEKTSFWKKPLTWVIAGVIAVAAIAAPVTYFALKGGKSDAEVSDTTKKTKKTTETTEDTTTTTTTEEPTTTTEAPTDTTPFRVESFKTYSIQDLDYDVTDEWGFLENDGYQYFVEDLSVRDNFMMVYSVQALTPVQAAAYDFDQFMDEFNTSVTTNDEFVNANILSCVTDTTTDLNTSDVSMTCEYQGRAKELKIHVILDRSTGYAYVFMIFMDADLTPELRQGYIDRFDTAIASIRKTNGQSDPTDNTVAQTSNLGNRTEYTLGDITYNVTNDWQFLTQGGFHYFFPNSIDAENFLMVYNVQTTTADIASAYDFDKFMQEFETSMLNSSDFPNAVILSSWSKKGDVLNEGELKMECDYAGKRKNLDMRVFLDKTTGMTYVFILYTDYSLDAQTRELYTQEYAAAADSVRHN